MTTSLRARVIIVTIVLLPALLLGCGGSTSSNVAPVAPVPPVNLVSAAQCSELVNSVRDTSVFPPNVAIVSATFTPAVAAVPATNTTPAIAAVAEHCNIIGNINAGRIGAQSSAGVTQIYAINFQVRLPTSWNGKLIMSGGGGTDGSVPNTLTNLNDGYATAANDSGHSGATNVDPLAGGSAAFGTDYQARVDFAYNAIDLTTRTAKALIATYYGRKSNFSYFQGCSMGGREAMMVTQRLPAYFDGVVAGDPAFRITKVGVWATYEGQQLASLAKSTGLISGNGVPFANNTFTDQDLQLVSNAILTACDGLDGLADGMVNNSQACTTAVVSPVLNALQCSGGKTAACLASGQITAITNIYTTGAPTSKGVAQYAPWMWDPGIAGCTSATDCNTPTATNINA